MSEAFRFQLRIAGIVVRFDLPAEIAVPEDLAVFRCEPSAEADDIYTVQLLTSPLRPAAPMVAAEGEAQIYETEKGWLHIYPALGDGDECQVACLFCPDGRHILYYPASRWAEYSQVWKCAHLICAERLLLRHGALLLHSSLVALQGQGVLFSAPSGTGKSTQASLWEQQLGARVLNGDRAVLHRQGGRFVASGSIWSGTSHIFCQETVPIRAIFLIEQAREVQVERLGFGAFVPLLSQILVNSWDPQFMGQAVDLLSALMAAVPVYRLACRPDRASVSAAYETVFGKEGQPWP